jgi:hypothetical protein
LITPTPPKKLSDGSQSASAKTKANSIIDNLTRLATAYNEPLTPDRIEVYTIALINLSPEELSHGFNRALRETKWWPKPSELIEFCTGRASAMADKLVIDEAWNWALGYIKLFGIPATKRWEIQGYVYHGEKLNPVIRNLNVVRVLATTAPYYELAAYHVPEIPDLISQTLIAMSGTVRMGMTRIKDASSGWNSAEEEASSSRDAAFVRRDFDEYCSRAIAANRAKTPAYISSGLQLAGEVVPMFPAFNPHKIAVRVEPDKDVYKVSYLEFEEAKRLFECGALPEALYDDAVTCNKELQRRELVQNTPYEFSAVYLGPYKPKIYGNDATPWPPMGKFTIENSDGSSVVSTDHPMAIGDLNPKLGQVFRFSASPRELVFDAFARRFFNLNQAVITKK